MKKIFIIAIIILASFSITGIVFAQEKINLFQADIIINSDASIDITETINYDFEDNPRHGIIRTIPFKYKERGGNFNLRISDLKIRDQNGNDYQFDKSDWGSDLILKIGDPDTYLTGEHSFVISYNIRRAINYFNEYDEFYWNVNGFETEVPTLKTVANIYLPYQGPKLKTDCFQGVGYSEEECDSIDISSKGNQSIISFSQSNLDYYENLSILVGFPKGIVYQPKWHEIAWETALDNLIVLLPIITFIIIYYLWYTKGKDPEGRGTVIAQFDAPDNLSPSQVGTLYDQIAHRKDISAEIINLAIRGYLKIKREEKGKVFKSTDYTLIKLKEAQGLNKIQIKLFNSLFEGEKKEVKLSDLKNKFYADFEIIVGKLYQSLISKKYFLKSPKKVKGTYLGIGFAIGFLSFFTAPFFGIIGLICTILSGLIVIAFSFFMPKRTKEGSIAYEHILGLKEYLTVAEKERIKFHNAPEKNPQEFERMLPYAMVLGVENQWAKQFKNIYQEQQPDWYQSAGDKNFSALNLVNNLSVFQNQSTSTLTSSPPSSVSAGGSSGFSSGGGFSGGGFGGGGVSSW